MTDSPNNDIWSVLNTALGVGQQLAVTLEQFNLACDHVVGVNNNQQHTNQPLFQQATILKHNIISKDSLNVTATNTRQAQRHETLRARQISQRTPRTTGSSEPQ